MRAGIVVTGTEVLTGRVTDRNGPWISERLAELGVEVAHILVVGDRPDDLEAALRFMAGEGVDLIVTSGGLGPTADDLTAEVVARFAGREMSLDEAMEEKIAGDPARLRPPPAPQRGRDPGGQPQAGDGPRGRDCDRPRRHGARPGRAGGGSVVVVLPGPPRELQPMWAVGDRDGAGAGGAGAGDAAARLHAAAVRDPRVGDRQQPARDRGGGHRPFGEVEITTCLRRGEIEIDVRYRERRLVDRRGGESRR